MFSPVPGLAGDSPWPIKAMDLMVAWVHGRLATSFNSPWQPEIGNQSTRGIPDPRPRRGRLGTRRLLRCRVLPRAGAPQGYGKAGEGCTRRRSQGQRDAGWADSGPLARLIKGRDGHSRYDATPGQGTRLAGSALFPSRQHSFGLRCCAPNAHRDSRV
ncbi:hypothetical protein ACTIVE_5924 [Actinomadura verrucosospora]|uniref:Uncharacterized protein n=1 Tax=Actinomadura verrucosospora TaxID=46165 RepID=A0A7D3ZMW4_ACTVE|nr:hypothetical protein ACTIVE_5924 [Actinomadura verrucosospora]